MIDANSFSSPVSRSFSDSSIPLLPMSTKLIADRVAEQRALRVGAHVDRLAAAARGIALRDSTPSAVVIVPRGICCASISGRRFWSFASSSSASNTAHFEVK